MPGNPIKKAHRGGAPRVSKSRAGSPRAMKAPRNPGATSPGTRAPRSTAQKGARTMVDNENPSRRRIPRVPKVKQPK